MIREVLTGIIAGATSALIGYFRHTPVPEFDPKKFMKTLIIGAIVGGTSPYFTEDVVTQFIESMGYVTLIDRIVDLIYARLIAIWEKATK